MEIPSVSFLPATRAAHEVFACDVVFSLGIGEFMVYWEVYWLLIHFRNSKVFDVILAVAVMIFSLETTKKQAQT